MDRLNILVVSSYFYPEGGGAENYAFNIARRLVKKGHKVTVLCSTHQGRSQEEVIDGVEIIRTKPDFRLSTTPIKLGLPFKLLRMLRGNKFDLINLNFYLVYYPDVAAIIGRVCKTPTVLLYHNDMFKEDLLVGSVINAYNHSLQRLTLSLTRKLIVASPYCYNESRFIRPFKSKAVWIPPGVDIEKYHVGDSFAIHDTYNLPHSAKIVLFVGGLSRVYQLKGVDYLIKSFPTVLAEVGDVYLVLVGRGDMIPQYQEMCSSLGISERVISTGFVDEDRLIEYYKSTNLLVLASTTIQEGFGMVLIEANASGKPVVGARVGGIQYVIRDGENGLLVPPKDSQALAEAIIRLLSDDDLSHKMGQRGREIAEGYSWDILAEQTEQVYWEVVKR